MVGKKERNDDGDDGGGVIIGGGEIIGGHIVYLISESESSNFQGIYPISASEHSGRKKGRKEGCITLGEEGQF